ncbi:MAG: ABC transporter permease [Candidatus Pacearchaeota archaeon]
MSWQIIKKDWLLIVKSKLALFSLFLLPALIVLILSFSLSTVGLQQVRLSYYYENLSTNALATTQSLLELLKSKGYEVVNASKERCIENIKSGGWHICLLISPGSTENELTINIYTDASRINFAYTLINHLSTLIQIRSEEISIDLIQAIINVLDTTTKKLNESNNKIVQLNKKLIGITTESGAIIATTNAINTDFNIKDFKIDRLNALIEELGNSSNLTSDFEDVASDIEAKLKEIERRFKVIESQKGSIKSSTSNISRIVEEIVIISSSVKNTSESIIKDIGSIKEKKPGILTSPIKTSVVSVTTKSKNIDFILPGFLTFIIVSLALFVSSTLTIKEKKSKAWFRLSLTPLSDLSFFFSSFASFFLILLIEIILALAIVSFFTNLLPISTIFSILPLIILAIALFIFIGMFIGNIAKSEEVVILINFFILLFFLFFSQTIMPHEMVKQTYGVTKVLTYSPFNIIENSLKQMLFFRFTLAKIWFSLFILAIYASIFFVIALLTKKLTKHTLIYS